MKKLLFVCSACLAFGLAGAIGAESANPAEILRIQESCNVVSELKLIADGRENATASLQKALDSGIRSLYFPAGRYLLDTVKLPAGTTLKFAVDAQICINPAGLTSIKNTVGESFTTLFVLDGDRITVEGLDADPILEQKNEKGQMICQRLFYGSGRRDLIFRQFRCRGEKQEPVQKSTQTWSVPGNKRMRYAFDLENCRNVEISGGEFRGIDLPINLLYCENASIRSNRAMYCGCFLVINYGSRNVRVYDNYGCKLRYLCQWRGGTPDPSRDKRVPLGSSKTVLRNLKFEDCQNPEKIRSELSASGAGGVTITDGQQLQHLYGAYDIILYGNYAEYCRALAWGNKTHDVAVIGNIARFMGDYAYGVEGCENALFANNIAINCRSYAIMSLYWGNRVMIVNNLCLIRNEPYDPELGDKPDQSWYWGGLLRLHHGPVTPEDTAAGSDYGSGNVLISGNELINECGDRVRSIVLDENFRDITIFGNRIVNGAVYTKVGGGRLTIAGNEFSSTLAQPHSFVSFLGSDELVLRNNIMRYEGKSLARQQGGEFDNREAAEVEGPVNFENLKSATPAIQIGSAQGTPKAVVIESNQLSGYAAVGAIKITVPGNWQPGSYIVRNNLVEGAIRINSPQQLPRLLIENNFDTRNWAQGKTDFIK